MQLQEVTSIDEMRALLDSNNYDFRYDVGVTQPSHTLALADLNCMVQSLAMHYAIVFVKAELDDIVEGLKTLDVLGLIRANGKQMCSLFLYSEPGPLTADKMMICLHQSCHLKVAIGESQKRKL